MPSYIFDIETNGLLPELDRVHCLVLKDIETGETHSYAFDLPTVSKPVSGVKDPIHPGLERLREADLIVGHNVIGFDLPALAKVYGFSINPSKVVIKDTMVLARLYEGNVKDRDLINWKAGTFPGQHIGWHTLKAWGHRLTEYKGDFDGPWDTWTQEMQNYCEQDVEVTWKLYHHLRKIADTWQCPIAEDLEHQAQWTCSQIERNGIPFDKESAAGLYAELCQLRNERQVALKDLFPPWTVFQGEYTSKASNKLTGHTKGAVYSKVKLMEFDPASRDIIADRFKVKYGWVPTEMTKGGKKGDKPKPKIDETVLGAMSYPEAKPLAELFLIEKRIGQIAEGEEAWLRHEKDGWIHHRLNPNGAVTGRATHSKPNISQVPKVGSKWGKECRSLFGVPEGWTLYGVDAASLELRCLSHFMSRWDHGGYGKAVIQGTEEAGTDVHSLNTKALGMEPQKVYVINGKQQKGRNCAKTFIYAFLYGAGAKKIATTLGRPVSHGARITKQFLAGLPALGKLKEAVEKATKRGYLLGLDKRRVHIRSSHAALNTLLQGAGALVCKKWMVEADSILQQQGLKHGWDGDYAFLWWCHDELGIACRSPEVAETVDEASRRAMKHTETFFDFQVPLDVTGKTGKTWADVH